MDEVLLYDSDDYDDPDELMMEGSDDDFSDLEWELEDNDDGDNVHGTVDGRNPSTSTTALADGLHGGPTSSTHTSVSTLPAQAPLPLLTPPHQVNK